MQKIRVVVMEMAHSTMDGLAAQQGPMAAVQDGRPSTLKF